MHLMDRRYLDIVAHYKDCLARHGDNHLGVEWPRREDAELRHAVMLYYTSLLRVSGKLLCFYNGNGFGRAGFGYAVAEDSGGSHLRAVA
jgi:hypothetical protein